MINNNHFKLISIILVFITIMMPSYSEWATYYVEPRSAYATTYINDHTDYMEFSCTFEGYEFLKFDSPRFDDFEIGEYDLILRFDQDEAISDIGYILENASFDRFMVLNRLGIKNWFNLIENHNSVLIEVINNNISEYFKFELIDAHNRIIHARKLCESYINYDEINLSDAKKVNEYGQGKEYVLIFNEGYKETIVTGYTISINQMPYKVIDRTNNELKEEVYIRAIKINN